MLNVPSYFWVLSIMLNVFHTMFPTITWSMCKEILILDNRAYILIFECVIMFG